MVNITGMSLHVRKLWVLAVAVVVTLGTMGAVTFLSSGTASADNLNVPTTILFGSASRVVNGVNVARGQDQTILYSSDYGANTGTNRYGVEATVVGGKVTIVDNRTTTNDPAATIPAKPGFVASFHGLSADWAVTNVHVGDVVTLKDSTGAVTNWPGSACAPNSTVTVTQTVTASATPTSTTATPTTTTPAPGAYPAKEVAGYQMLWSTDPDVLSSLPSQDNVVRLAFFNDGGNIPGGVSPGIVGYASGGKAQMVSELRTFVNRGGRVTLSLGGGGQTLSLANTTNVVNRVQAVIADLSDAQGALITGIDWDIESTDFTDAGVFNVSQALVNANGGASQFDVTMVPNGGNIETYLPTGKRLWQAGYLDSFGQQFYDAPMTEAAIDSRVNEYLGTGMPIALYAVGMMIGTDSSHPTEPTYNSWFIQLQQAHPGLDRAYLWELSRAGTSQWAADMAADEAAR